MDQYTQEKGRIIVVERTEEFYNTFMKRRLIFLDDAVGDHHLQVFAAD